MGLCTSPLHRYDPFISCPAAAIQPQGALGIQSLGVILRSSGRGGEGGPCIDPRPPSACSPHLSYLETERFGDYTDGKAASAQSHVE